MIELLLNTDSSWSSPSQLAETSQLGTYTGPDGTVYTGNGQFTVTDSYTCNSPPCGGFDVADPTAPEFAVPVLAPGVEEKETADRGVRPTPAHFLMTAHALTFGMLSATGKLLQGDEADWAKNFANDSTEAADAVTPLGGYILKSSFDN